MILLHYSVADATNERLKMQLSPNILAMSHLIGARRHMGYIGAASNVISDAIVKIIWASSLEEMPHINMLLTIEMETAKSKFEAIRLG
jgi:hypothetical protein